MHSVMKELLRDVQEIEKWPIDVCGEVDAMNGKIEAYMA